MSEQSPERRDIRTPSRDQGVDHLLADAIRRGTRFIREHGLDGLEPEILRPEAETHS